MNDLNKLLDLAEGPLYNPNANDIYCATDDPKFWTTDNLKGNPGLRRLRKKTIIYKFNNQGFRCDEFTTTSELPILFLGCSHTMGVGLDIEDVWSKILLEKIKNYTGKEIPFWNLSIGGSSIDRQAVVLEKYINELNPKLIFFLVPSMFRRQIALIDKVLDYRPTRMNPYEYGRVIIKYLARSESLLLDENYAAYESYKNLRLIDTLAKLKKSKIYYHVGIENQENNVHEGVRKEDPQNEVPNMIKTMCDRLSSFNNLDVRFDCFDVARDGMHLGQISNRKFAEDVFEKIKDQL